MFAGVAASGRYHGGGAYGDHYGARYRGDPRRFAAYTLAALWDAHVPTSVTLNGADVAGWASLVAGGVDFSQGTAANQPLYTGAPSYNNQRSIQGTAANGDVLLKTNVDLVGTGPSTWILVSNNRTGANARVMDNSQNESQGMVLQNAAAALDWTCWGATGRAGPALTANALHVVILYDTPGATARCTADGVDATLGSATSTRFAPGPTALMSIFAGVLGGSSSDADICYAGVFSTNPGTGVVQRMSRSLGARFGRPG